MPKKRKPKQPPEKILYTGDAPGGNYTEQLAELLRTGPHEVGVHSVEIAHDNWCAIFKSLPCNCNPEIKAPKKL